MKPSLNQDYQVTKGFLTFWKARISLFHIGFMKQMCAMGTSLRCSKRLHTYNGSHISVST